MRDIVDIGTGDVIAPIVTGKFAGQHLGWHPSDGSERVFMQNWGAYRFRIGKNDGQLAWFQIEPPCAPFGPTHYSAYAWFLASGMKPNWSGDDEISTLVIRYT